MAKFVVLGAGVVGVTTAWRLLKDGHNVTLVDRHDGACGGTSEKNGAQLSYSYCDALASPGLIPRLPAILTGRDQAFRIRLQPDMSFLSWGLRFLLNCTSNAHHGNTKALLKLAAATERLMPALLDEFPLSFNYAKPGKLVLCHDAEAYNQAGISIARKRSYGIEMELLNRAEAERIEPALRTYSDDFVGAVYSPNDAVGDPRSFCSGLIAGLVKTYGLQTCFGYEATRLIRRNGKLIGVGFLNREMERCDGVVLATGHDTTLLSDRGGGTAWPVQGYSITIPAPSGAMTMSITDPKRRIVFARLADKIRMAGVADVGARRFSFDQERFEAFKNEAMSAFFPKSTIREFEGWSGARPCTPSSRPLIGRSKTDGVYLNLGHGAFGWTLSLGSAESLANSIASDMI